MGRREWLEPVKVRSSPGSGSRRWRPLRRARGRPPRGAPLFLVMDRSMRAARRADGLCSWVTGGAAAAELSASPDLRLPPPMQIRRPPATPRPKAAPHPRNAKFFPYLRPPPPLQTPRSIRIQGRAHLSRERENPPAGPPASPGPSPASAAVGASRTRPRRGLPCRPQKEGPGRDVRSVTAALSGGPRRCFVTQPYRCTKFRSDRLGVCFVVGFLRAPPAVRTASAGSADPLLQLREHGGLVAGAHDPLLLRAVLEHDHRGDAHHIV